MSHTAESQRHISLDRIENYRFRVRFDEPGMPELITDEPPPMGSGSGPGPAELLGAAVGNCLTSSLLFCFQKSRIDVTGLAVDIIVSMERNQQGRLRIPAIKVEISPEIAAADRDRIGRCTGLFESFCTVTESIRAGITVHVDVMPRITDPAVLTEKPES